jgi:hypothetical protein
MEKLKKSIRDLGETWSYVNEQAGVEGMKGALKRAEATARQQADEARDIANSTAATNVARHMIELAKDNQAWQAAQDAKKVALENIRNELDKQLKIQEAMTRAAERETAARAAMARQQRQQSTISRLARQLVGLPTEGGLGAASLEGRDAPVLQALQVANDLLSTIAAKTGATMDSFTVGNLTGQTMAREASLLGAAGLAYMH